jgi:DNA-binding NarL/FixJ family response regulator
VIDDDKSQLNMFADLLRLDGYNYICFNDMENILNELARQTFDVALIDIDLNHETLDGFKLSRYIKNNFTNNPKTILISGVKIDAESRRFAFENEADDFVIKPCTGDELVYRIEKLIKQRDLENTLIKDNSKLEENNSILKEILSQLEISKKRLEQNVVENINTIILPIVKRMKNQQNNERNIGLLLSNLENITKPYGLRISKLSLKLTQREIEICNMIRSGLSTQDIAQILNLTPGTVECHRNNIRSKLGIKEKKINLFNYLSSL